jgi:glycosyltransferase involved in cell wall biosynthesis
MKIRFIELAEPLREGGLEKAAADMARYLPGAGVEVVRGPLEAGGLQGFDVVHFHGLWSPEHFRIARQARRAGLPVVVSPHGMLEPWAWKHRKWKKWPYFHLVEKRRLQAAEALLATAEEEAEHIRSFFPASRIEVLPLGIEPEARPDYAAARARLGWEDGERVLLYLSRVHPKKGLRELILALRELPEEAVRRQPVRLVVVGNGPEEYMAECRSLAGGLEDRIRVDWIPPQWGEAKWPWMQGADLFCLPTYSENFGLVILEAGMVGTPVFTTTGTPWKEVEEAGFGWVPAPEPERYAGVLEAFLGTPDAVLQAMRPAFADWTRERYAWPSLVGRYAAFYQALVSRQDSIRSS